MHCFLTEKDRLTLLRSLPGPRPWQSCRERRRCVLCDRVFDGRQLPVRWTRAHGLQVACPTRGCHSTPEMWVHHAEPLTSEEAWNDWDQALRALELQESAAEPFAVTAASRFSSGL